MIYCLLPSPGGVRDRFLSQAVRYWKRQTYKDKRLVICEDGGLPTPLTDVEVSGCNAITLIRRTREPTDGVRMTLTQNLRRALTAVPQGIEYVSFWEDDDWYHPERLKFQVSHVNGLDLHGWDGIVYYNLKYRQWEWMKSVRRTSNTMMLVKRGAVEGCLKTRGIDLEHFFDITLVKWMQQHGYGRFSITCMEVSTTPQYVIGMKHGVGTRGRTVATHQRTLRNADPELRFLRQHIGDDVQFYESLRGL